jgi:hypothetical protein
MIVDVSIISFVVLLIGMMVAPERRSTVVRTKTAAAAA